MQLDKQALERLLTLNDKQLRQVITRLMADAGLDPASLKLSDADIARLRTMLSGADDREIQQLQRQLGTLGLGQSGARTRQTDGQASDGGGGGT